VQENGEFSVLFLPPNMSSLLQPMDQGVNECTKRLYRKKLLQKLLLADGSEESVTDFYKRNNLECAYMASDAWNNVKTITLKTACQNIRGVSESEPSTELVESNEGELANTVSKVIVSIPMICMFAS
jgi:hypothetical protein